ncbi:hypothetical protein P5705_05230 [Pseudomonas entomophila]|uniref:hypothetical protein n=1 Tax=Pseudomonas entomophila TaxID=312306 RepID=UPI002404B765|nr:hypothetical protein [Pseudomonas entomophila]MDF9617036.1 hypothetical protein [Pseudomonas entomophila]
MGLFQAAGLVIRGFTCGGGVAVILAISGCTGRAESQVQYVRVEVPVQVPCQTPGVSAPAWAAADLRKTDSLEVKVRVLLAERRQRIGYEKQLEAGGRVCQ